MKIAIRDDNGDSATTYFDFSDDTGARFCIARYMCDDWFINTTFVHAENADLETTVSNATLTKVLACDSVAAAIRLIKQHAK